MMGRGTYFYGMPFYGVGPIGYGILRTVTKGLFRKFSMAELPASVITIARKMRRFAVVRGGAGPYF